jgi:nucleotide-binding universal stress UspA family protein
MPISKIMDSVREHRVDMLVMTTQGHGGPTHWRLGRVVEGVLQHGRVPVLIVPVQAATTQSVKVGYEEVDVVTS